MTFRFEEENFQNLYVLEDYYCTDPFCDCNHVTISFSDKEKVDNRITFLLNFNRTHTSLPDQTKLTPGQSQIVKKFLKEIPDELMNLFRQRYHEAKAYGEKNPKSYLIFEPDKYVNYMLMFPKNKEMLDFTFKGGKYYAEDAYKMDPRCDDFNAQLTFYKVDPSADNTPPVFSHIYHIDENLREAEDKNLTEEESEILFELNRFIPGLDKLIKKRLKESRKVGEELMKSSVKAPVKSHKPLRNELCSCGSGKKYKKCCALKLN